MQLQIIPFLSKLVILFTCVLLGAATSVAQQCTLKADQFATPELFGFHLGMTFDEVKTREPLVQFGRADEFGITKTSINPAFDQKFDQKRYADVRTISFDFLDGKLSTLWIGYESSFKWRTIDEYVEGISAALKLPGNWQAKRNGKNLACDGFAVSISMIAGSPSIRLTDNAGEETIAARREEAAAAAESVVIADKSTKLYYTSDCDAAEKVAAPNRTTFKSQAEAEKAGYKLAKDCQ